MRVALIGCILVATSVGAATALPGAPGGQAEPPAWFHRHMEFITQEGGRWVADNSTYRNDDEPFDAYGIEWSWGLGKKGLTGRLFGLQAGKEVATFWEFRIFWHPGEGKVQVYQFGGDGTVGAGTMNSAGEGKTRIEQVFFYPDGRSAPVAHDSSDTPEKTHVTKSYNGTAEGSWKDDRLYTWRLAKAPA